MQGSDYVEGRKFLVVREGARFEGLLLHGEQTIAGWSRRITPGEVLTCLGWSDVNALGTQIKGVMWTGAKVPDSAIVMTIWPFESIFRPYPLDGLLEFYDDPDVDVPAAMPVPDLSEIDDGTEVDLTTHLPVLERPKDDTNEEVDLRGL